MKGKVFKRGKTWTYVVDLPPDPATGQRNQKKKGGFPSQKKQIVHWLHFSPACIKATTFQKTI